MPSANKCRECGSALPADSPRGFCAGCLLALALDRGGSEEGAVESVRAQRVEILNQEARKIEPHSQVSASVSDEPGDRIGRYRLIEEIGHGGCGVVYLAEQEEP